MSQMQAFWRLTDSTLYTLYADRTRKSTNSPHFAGYSVPKRAREKSRILSRDSEPVLLAAKLKYLHPDFHHFSDFVVDHWDINCSG